MTRLVLKRRRSRWRSPLGYWGFTLLTLVSLAAGNVTAAAVSATLAYCFKPQNGRRRR